MKAASLLLAGVLVLTAIAGCLTATDPSVEPAAATPLVSIPLYEKILQEETYIPTFDGIELYGVVYRPDVPDGTKVPVIVDYGPYFGNSKPTGLEGGNAFSQWLIDFFVPRGYAVVIQNVRSTGPSGGCWDHGGLKEQQDSYEMVEFYGNEDWSNGKVALIGKSYDGTTPWEAAIMQPPSLATIVPMSGITHMYGYNYYNGVGYNIQGPLFNTYYPLMVDWNVDPFGADAEPSTAWTESACDQFVQVVAEGLATHVTGTYTDFWHERDYRPKIPDVQVPVFLIHGLQDWNVKPDHIAEAYNDLQTPKMAWLGQWGHDYPHRKDWNDTLLTWFDHWLKGYDNGVERLYGAHVADSLGRWRIEPDWPPTRAQNLTFHLGDGALSPEPTAAGMAPFTSLPTTEPNPATDRVPGEAVYFTTEPLAEDTHVSGVPQVTLHLASTKPVGRAVATLFDVDENGTWTWIDYAFLDLKHRESLDDVQPIVPGEVMNVTFDFYPTDTVFQAGHRIGLAVSSEAFDFILPDGSQPVTEVLHWGGATPSTLTLPVLPETTVLDPQPELFERCDVPGNCS